MATIKQHRHYWPGWKNPEELGWHDADVVHAKYPTAHEHIHSERTIERDVKPAKGKAKAPALSFNEYGEPLTEADINPDVKLYQNPPEYAALDAEAMVREAAAHLLKTTARK